ncbi:hypothetical protein LDENG_00235720 [Lucifuga dentata]|nr:hypothetical protein LDENG_00235720 [Lucifuga dentata]
MGDGGPLHTEGNALLKAVFQGKLRLTRLLLEGGAYINEGNERGETPISAACLASYDDPQTRQRMARYLLEKGADPNIPDKSGRTALMHACAEQAGKENGADPSLKDYSGSSALVHAINKGDRDTLQVLLDACKAKGKEVIIITTDMSPSGTKKTKQYLNSPPSPGIVDKLSPTCMSPSEVEIGTSSSPAADKDKEGIFSFALTSALPLPSSRPSGEKRPPPRKLLKRLNSEPWGLVAPSVLVPQERVDRGLEEESGCNFSRTITEMNGLSISEPARPLLSRRHSIETHDPCSPKVIDRSCSEDCAALWADKVQQHQILCRRNTAPESQENTGGPAAVRALAHPKLTRMEHCDSDAHLCPESIPGSPDSGHMSVERQRYNASPLSLFTSLSRESLENIPNSPIVMRRRPPGLLERRGSGTLLLDHISQTRPGFLPPLNINPQRPIPDIKANGKPTSPVHSSHKILVPVAPASPKRGPDFKMKKKLMRRHSMQTEQMKQLSTFQEILAEKVVESIGD